MVVRHNIIDNNFPFLYFITFMLTDLPENVEDYHDVYPLDIFGHTSKILTYSTSTYRATHSKTGEKCCLKRIHGKNSFIKYYFMMQRSVLDSNLKLIRIYYFKNCTLHILF